MPRLVAPIDPPPARPSLPPGPAREDRGARRLAARLRARGVPVRLWRWLLQFCYALAMAAATAMICLGLQLPLPITLAAFAVALVLAAAIIRASDPG